MTCFNLAKKLEMDGTSVLFGAVSLVLLLAIFGMNISNQKTPLTHAKREGFVDASGSVQAQTQTQAQTQQQQPQQSPIETSIRAVLGMMDSAELCPVFQELRDTMIKNEKGGKSISDEEAAAKVEKQLALSIPGGPLPCPLLVYPRKGSSDLEWLDFLQKVPSDFGARVVFMAVYAQATFSKTEAKLRAVLAGEKVPEQEDGSEGFSTICPPDVAATRRAEKQTKAIQSCILPEDMDADTIRTAVEELLKNLIATKTTVLKTKGMDPQINIKPILQKARESTVFLKAKQEEAQEGTLRPNIKSD